MKIPSQNERECGIQAAPWDRYIGQTMVVQNVVTLLRCRWCLLKKITQVLQRKWNKRSTVVLQEEIAKNNEVVCRRMSESQKKGTKAQNIEKTQTKWIRHGWKNRRRSVSRLPCSLLTVYWFGHIYIIWIWGWLCPPCHFRSSSTSSSSSSSSTPLGLRPIRGTIQAEIVCFSRWLSNVKIC